MDTTSTTDNGLACLLRAQDRLIEILADVGDTFGPAAAATIGAQAVGLFRAIKDASKEARG